MNFPHNLEAEECILGGILFDPTAMARIADYLCAEAFYSFGHQIIYKACLSLYEDRHAIDLMTVTDWLVNHDQLTSIGGTTKLAQLTERSLSATNIDRYANIVMDKYNRRRLMASGEDITGLASNLTIPLPDVLAQSEQLVTAISSEYRTLNSTVPIHTVVDSFMRQIEDTTQCQIYRTGFYELNRLIVGFEPKTLSIVAGRTSMGKSQVALQIALDHAILHNQSVLFFSLEMSKEQLTSRLISLVSGHPSFVNSPEYGITPFRRNRVKEHFSALALGEDDHPDLLSTDELSNLWSLTGIVGSLPIYVNDNRSISIEQLLSQTRKTAAVAIKPLGMIIVDYIQQFGGVEGSKSGDNFEAANRSYIIGDVVRQLYNLAHELNLCVVALSQISRGVETRNNKRPMLSDLSQSGEIETKADNVILCYRDEYYNPNSIDHDTMELIVAKARHGEIGNLKLFLEPNTGCFYNPS